MAKTSIRTSVEEWYSRIAARPFRGAWQGIAVITLGTSLRAGCLVRLTDPSRFHSIWAGMWWGMQTVTTVGYGDTVPGSVAGRIAGVLVMLIGISFITVTAGAITSEFVEAARRRRQRTPGEDAEAALIRGLSAQVDSLQAKVTALQGTIEQLSRDLRTDRRG